MAGIYITQPGVSVPYAADYQFVFNSDWPSLAIAFETVVTVAGSGNATVPHNLGFFPFVVAWDVTGGITNGRITQGVSFDKVNIKLINYSSSSAKYSIKCYNLDITKAASYKLPQFPTVKTAYDPSTGIKVVKSGRVMASNDLRDYILHSRAQSPAVLQVLTQPTNINTSGSNPVYTIAYTDPAHYTPWAFAFSSGDGTSYQCVFPGPSQALPAFKPSAPIDNPPYYTKGQIFLQYGNYGGSTVGHGSLIVLRDPLVVANTKRVVYG